ncbi:nucleoside triphosphate pyrophosphohydrolase [Vibrio hippocampi]|uniref:Nucleoside triphosphate pyrophosphohydrolase n=1 Tax=Vibrio hippocampi TaxID=654686 RepID=A0ABN8DJ64_9VIBR|nr:nucleoside triphosphate pyrophosphohydrolase [Vibrio hippocampi]CAH0527140.1 Nucleoside triphosphate pyrophosphohydrolase [Vibrio hippocampi]
MSQAVHQLLNIMSQLRDPEQGCPWDKKQTFETIVPYTIEETFEVADAIHNQDWVNLQEELGDLLFQVIFYSQMAKEQQLFDFEDVVEGLNNKLTRRHPHVFSDVEFDDEASIQANWEAEKRKEKTALGKTEQSILDSIPNSLPALSKANKIQKRCAKYGFDWDTLEPVIDKVKEELEEVRVEAIQSPISDDKVQEEVGDLLFAAVNLARHLGQDPETALSQANNKFMRRFKGVECKAAQQGGALTDYSLAQLDGFWDQVKQEEKQDKT